jgi:glycosyltransferase involved in cell wall biosynthesis
MKVAIFTDTYLPEVNGVAKTLGRLTGYMYENGIEYRVFAPSYRNAVQDKSVVRFPSFNFLLYPESKISIPLYAEIRKELNHFKPDIIHVATPFGIGLCGLKYANAEKIPMVSSYHTNYSQYLEYFNLKLFEQISWKYLKWFHKQSRINYCPSYSAISLLKGKGIENLELWSRGINTVAFSPVYRDIEFRRKLNCADKIVFLYVGRISPEKDIDILLSTAKK